MQFSTGCFSSGAEPLEMEASLSMVVFSSFAVRVSIVDIIIASVFFSFSFPPEVLMGSFRQSFPSLPTTSIL